ncbi:MAG: hypothetical protein L3K19_03015 [Thermoplasmata archaeon]|nr:hypothetical protein [Thermoplasmata archaeon]
MKLLGTLLVPSVVLLLLAVVPTAAGSASVTGTATSCSQLTSCYFVLNGTAGSGYAVTSVFGSIGFRLPGETNATIGTYSAMVVNRSGTIDHVQGTAFGIDANTGKVVLGSTDVYVNATQHCSRTGCGYTYKLVSGTISLRVTNYDGTRVAVSCSPQTFGAGGSTHCTANVTDLANRSTAPTGTVTFSTYSGAGAIGKFSNHGVCTLVSGSCTVRFTAFDNTVGNFQIIGTYHGAHAFFKSIGTGSVSVSDN